MPNTKNTTNAVSEFKDKVILVTGGTGSIGSELVAQLLGCQPRSIRVFSRNENSQYHLLEKLGHPKNVRMLIGDIRDKERLSMALYGVDLVFHAAALKHVPFCEYNPYEVVKTNIIGSQNLIEGAVQNGVKKVIAISTDKVANPFNVLGISKLMMERLFVNQSHFLGRDTKFTCVRFGNVAWSKGSVLPLWQRQAEKHGAINITDKKMTRFLMSTDQAVNLTLKAAELCQGGEVFILKMPAIKLPTLASVFLNKYFPGKKIKIKETGNRGGEKTHEHLLGQNDWTREILHNKEMFVLLPATHIHNIEYVVNTYPGFKKVSSGGEYSSKDNIDTDAVKKFI
ncbi:MAG: hypothetical protein A3B99_04095 [Candidatus Yanofskybacteria bacterium RIFCSPHIGHO2_02_FULL_44_12b]|uniref:Polysaccharide biosynthesis protein CapD-like domain-containing protein n=2 Tax=Candidatus Yanofskyibacteriota TaxID=1752733 RepID=A0A1F8GMW6_9BACT|nr:MAG: Polysaccharide biosynthesis protein CapD [Candidatus Yanofskybacteria bacterium GW2011_GWA2_44_9]OGN04638.1 MAG: hypothetical protein A2659_00745 [Candidatus Yanofskybacteria bacterium RIFCSPHIGHO2_01_FULL_44_24]OGN15696.1 MAG: hypothetical protein A3B99_04095 [Candidatus Yanofskybacteria bacterium RIFCSPHIGHO2_02_FULL_44_12b]OGN26752.1 MAG: hypothetical protein A2925_04180 [Candidatus Yanofskybacteria bacterium RIFCSPLOWO2_01_FULL_44_22]